MKRWLILSLGLAMAAGAVWVLVSPSGPGAAPPLDEIDDASRAHLERVLRDADSGEPGR